MRGSVFGIRDVWRQPDASLRRVERTHVDSTVLSLGALNGVKEMTSVRKENRETVLAFSTLQVQLCEKFGFAARCGNLHDPRLFVSGGASAKEDSTVRAPRP